MIKVNIQCEEHYGTIQGGLDHINAFTQKIMDESKEMNRVFPFGIQYIPNPDKPGIGKTLLYYELRNIFGDPV